MIRLVVAAVVILGLLARPEPAGAGHPFGLQLPWPSGYPSGGQHRIQGWPPEEAGQSYNCGGHTDSQNYNGYAIDFDFDIPGEPVAAVAGGSVIARDGSDEDQRGFYVEIQHGTLDGIGAGHRSRYLHLNLSQPWPPGITEGGFVREGQVIGYSGNTGSMTTGPHLHFDLKRYLGSAKNTLPFESIAPEPMSSQSAFGQWGLCSPHPAGDARTSPYWHPDGDGDGYTEGEETAVGTSIFDRCFVGASFFSDPSWPADLMGDGLSADRVDLQDFASFVAPVVRFGTGPGQPEYNPRWNLSPIPSISIRGTWGR